MGEFRLIAATTFIAVMASFLSSTLLSWVEVGGVKPDLALVIIALIAVRRGSMPGEIAGFASGLVADMISVGPLGLTAMTRTVVGYAVGRMAGLVTLDWLLLPTIVAIAATVLKAFTVTVLALVVPWISGIYGVGALGFLRSFLIEAAFNGVVAPALYVLVSLLPWIRGRSPRQPPAARLGS